MSGVNSALRPLRAHTEMYHSSFISCHYLSPVSCHANSEALSFLLLCSAAMQLETQISCFLFLIDLSHHIFVHILITVTCKSIISILKNILESARA